MARKANIYILNYNGKELLKRCLWSVIKAAKSTGGDVIVIDNNSSDDSVSFVRNNFSKVLVKRLQTNNYLFSYNQIIKEDPYEYVILLNNDVFVETDFAQPLLEHFDDPTVFAVGGKVFDWNGEIRRINRRVGKFEYGWFSYGPFLTKVDTVGCTLYVSGACMAIDKKKFLQLGGFDNLYRPFYFEDQDICYRAWKRGWRCIYEPRSIVHHQISSSISKVFILEEKGIIFRKNYFLFYWRNITDPILMLEHWIFMPYRLVKALLHRDYVYIRGFWRAFRQIGEVIKKRRLFYFPGSISDKEICFISQKDLK